MTISAASSRTVTFADVAHQNLIFDRRDRADSLILRLIDTKWVQRLRNISQTGNTRLVYMFAEHSRFGHSLGVAYLASLLMRTLRERSPEMVEPFQQAVGAAAVLHDIGHVAPGSHLAEKVWSPESRGQHEKVTQRIVREDPEINAVLLSEDPGLPHQVAAILAGSAAVPPWTVSAISGGGWNADRGNWSIVDSAMCAVSYGRYNVTALIDAFRLSEDGALVLQENRLDALTHFFVSRDSMYRQVYQHRVLQAADVLTQRIVLRLRDILNRTGAGADDFSQELKRLNIYCDEPMLAALTSREFGKCLSLENIFEMTENWWSYHVGKWCASRDEILADMARRIRDRRLLKTVRLEGDEGSPEAEDLEARAVGIAAECGFDPRYYVSVIEEKDKHRAKAEQMPMVRLESGRIGPVSEVEPMIDQIMRRPPATRRWLAIPAEVKRRLVE